MLHLHLFIYNIKKGLVFFANNSISCCTVAQFETETKDDF